MISSLEEMVLMKVEYSSNLSGSIVILANTIKLKRQSSKTSKYAFRKVCLHKLFVVDKLGHVTEYVWVHRKEVAGDIPILSLILVIEPGTKRIICSTILVEGRVK